jgi:hypothetical protein
VKGLHSVGLGGPCGKVRPARWQVDSNLLGALKVASIDLCVANETFS